MNAGVASVGPALSAPDQDARWAFDVNVLGAMRATRAFVPAMAAAGRGTVCFTASIAGLVGTPGMPIYSASKFAVVGFAESLRIELEGSGVSVTVLCPGFVRTGLHRATPDHHAGFAGFIEDGARLHRVDLRRGRGPWPVGLASPLDHARSTLRRVL